MTKTILITGRVASGKTHLLKHLIQNTKKSWEIDGYYCPAISDRTHKSNIAANNYEIHFIRNKHKEIWATKNITTNTFDFNEEAINKFVLNQKEIDNSDLFFFDDIGALELEEKGLAAHLKKISTSSIRNKFLIIVVKRRLLQDICNHFNINPDLIIDLDQDDFKSAYKKTIQFLYQSDGDRIAVFSAIAASIEVVAGSTLHALHIPLKGHFLALVQNYLLIYFGKALQGRNLFWITSITAALKSFSPAGSKIKPMIYIFLQGVIFLLPSKIIGFNFLSVLIGSILMGQFTLFGSFLMDYILFGQAVIDSYINGVDKVLAWFGFNNLSFLQIVCLFVILKIILSLIIASTYFLKKLSKLETWSLRFTNEKKFSSKEYFLAQPKFKVSMKHALIDLLSPAFYLPFILLSLMIFFFSGIDSISFGITILRGLILAWLGFLIARRIDYNKIIQFLEKRNLKHVADGIREAHAILEKIKRTNF